MLELLVHKGSPGGWTEERPGDKNGTDGPSRVLEWCAQVQACREVPGPGQRLAEPRALSAPPPPQQVKQFLLLSRQRPGLVAQCLRDSESSKPSFMPRLYINRRLAMEHRACPSRDPACKNAVFTQVWTTPGLSAPGAVRGLGRRGLDQKRPDEVLTQALL